MHAEMMARIALEQRQDDVGEEEGEDEEDRTRLRDLRKKRSEQGDDWRLDPTVRIIPASSCIAPPIVLAARPNAHLLRHLPGSTSHPFEQLPHSPIRHHGL